MALTYFRFLLRSFVRPLFRGFSRLLVRSFVRLLLRGAALTSRVPAGVVPVLGRGGFVVRLFAGRDPPWPR